MKYVCLKNVYESDLMENNNVVIHLFKRNEENVVFRKEKKYELMDPCLPSDYITLYGDDGQIYELIKEIFNKYFKYELLVRE